MLVGQSGSGKTNALIACIMSRMQKGHNIHLVDTKNELSQIFKKHMKIYTRKQVPEMISFFTKVAQDRMELFNRAAETLGKPIANITAYNKATGANLPIISIIVEELIIITGMIDESILTELFVAGRSSGVFFLCVTQRLKVDILSSTASNNFLTRVYLGAPDKYAFRSTFPAGIPKEIQLQVQSHLGPPGKALYHNSLTNEYKCITFPIVSEGMLIELMQ